MAKMATMMFLFLLTVLPIAEGGMFLAGLTCGACWHFYRQHWRIVVANGAHAFVPWGPPAHATGLVAEYFTCQTICAAAAAAPTP